MGIPFQDSVLGRRFLEGTVPKGIAAINRLAAAIEKQNELAESATSQSQQHKRTLFICYELGKSNQYDLLHLFATISNEKVLVWLEARLQDAFKNGRSTMNPHSVVSAKSYILNSNGTGEICIADADGLYSYSICVKMQSWEE